MTTNEKIAICITAGEQSENHVGMQKNGTGLAEKGFSPDELQLCKETLAKPYFASKGPRTRTPALIVFKR